MYEGTSIGSLCGMMRWLGLLLALSLTACGAVGTAVTESLEATEREKSAFPVNYRAETVAFLRTYLNDPSNIRDAGITEPSYRSIGNNEDRFALCVRFNAKKSSGGYAGAREHLVIFLTGRLDRIIEARRGECREASYQPFPELERLSR